MNVSEEYVALCSIGEEGPFEFDRFGWRRDLESFSVQLTEILNMSFIASLKRKKMIAHGDGLSIVFGFELLVGALFQRLRRWRASGCISHLVSITGGNR